MSDAQIPQEQNSDTPKRASELGTRVISSVVLMIAAIATAWIGGLVFLAVWAVAALAVWWEWICIVKAEPRPVVVGIGAAAIAGMTISLFADAAVLAFVCAFVGAAVAAASVQTSRLWIAGGLAYAAAVLIPAVMLRSDPTLGFVAILWLFAVVWGEDTGAYFAGRYFGGPKLAVSISPNKTWSGAAGGTAVGLLAGNAVILLAGIAWHPAHLIVAFVIVTAAQAGDLLESAVKRRFAVKDASTLVPGHGGLMDRIDGFIVAAVLALAIGLAHGGTQSPAAGLLLW
jgi:phosphatidate cytidylyltransferase